MWLLTAEGYTVVFMQMILKFIYHYPLQMQEVLYSSLELVLMTFFAG